MPGLYRRYVCVVCGHVEHVPLDQELRADYCCPLCEAPRSAMRASDDPKLQRQGLAIEAIGESVLALRRAPPFAPDWNHVAYALAHPSGLVLFDAPPHFDEASIAAVRALGRPRLLLVSHSDFVGHARDWCEALAIDGWMGAGDEPLGGNRFVPARRIDAPFALADDLEIVPTPGHSPGSLSLYWSGAAGGPVLCSGDAITAWPHRDGRTQLCFFQSAPLHPSTEAVARRPIELLATAMGPLGQAGAHVAALRACPDPFARPYRGDGGGVWLAR